MAHPDLIALLREPPALVPLAAAREMRRHAEGRYVLESDDDRFDIERFVSDRHASAQLLPRVPHQYVHSWAGEHEPIVRELAAGWLEIDWRGERLEALVLTVPAAYGSRRLVFLIAADRARAEAFFAAVCAHVDGVRGEVLVWANCAWHRSEALQKSIDATSISDLVLAPNLGERLVRDFDEFLAAKGEYERLGVPWKRGALFLGPAGNGKTIALKAVLRHLRLPVLYVQSFKAPHGATDHQGIREVFARARRNPPCALVLEDLDSLVTDETRAYVLNELDGFAVNTGLVVLATTNHPERLDPALVDRPSRFDRKYRFELPAAPERERYLVVFSSRLAEEARLSAPDASGLAVATEGFSFAYLKELMLSGLMRWPEARRRGDRFGAVLEGEVASLRAQMASGNAASAEAPLVPADPMA